MSGNNYEQKIKYETYEFLMETYIETIHKLIDFAYKLNILPLKLIFGINYIKKYISENRFETLQNGINYLLKNKETILSFDIKNLDELDVDSDDNMSIKSCVNNINRNSNLSQGIPNDTDQILNLMIEIKNNAKKLSIEDIELVKKHFELIVMILQQIENLFL
jgi:hypothetical protein